MIWQAWVALVIAGAVMSLIAWMIIVILTDESMPIGTFLATRNEIRERRRAEMSSNAWNIKDAEPSEPVIFNELAAEFGEYILTAPKVESDD